MLNTFYQPSGQRRIPREENLLKSWFIVKERSERTDLAKKAVMIVSENSSRFNEILYFNSGFLDSRTEGGTDEKALHCNRLRRRENFG